MGKKKKEKKTRDKKVAKDSAKKSDSKDDKLKPVIVEISVLENNGIGIPPEALLQGSLR